LLHLGISFVEESHHQQVSVSVEYDEVTDPRFSHDMWNVYQRTLQELPRTNNNIEGWHRGFQSLIGSCHPNIWTFLGKLKRQQSLHHIQLTQILAGDVIPQRKKYQDAASRVLHLGFSR
jgi:hypothetical protein